MQAPKLVSPTLNGNTYEKQAKHPCSPAPLGVYFPTFFQGEFRVLLIVALMETISENRGARRGVRTSTGTLQG